MAIVAGTKAETVIEVLQKIPERQRLKVKEITLDMAGNMELIAKRCFRSAVRVTDRFHVQKLATEALQEMRIKYRWEALDAENEAIDKARKTKTSFRPRSCPTGTPLNNYWPGQDMCCIKSLQPGLKIKKNVLNYSLSVIQITTGL